MPYLTPPTIPTETFCRVIRIPANFVMLAAVLGALTELEKPENWESVESASVDDTVAAVKEMLANYSQEVCVSRVGEIIAVCSLAALPANALPMDGIERDGADYPALFDVIPLEWIDGDNFTLPDMHWRTTVGNDQEQEFSNPLIGVVGGEQQHTLTLTEMPAHDHVPNASVNGHEYTPTAGVFGLPAGTDWSHASIASEGGGSSHNNMPPYLAVIYAIIAS